MADSDIFCAAVGGMLLGEQTRARRDARACGDVSTARADCCCELLLRAWRAEEVERSMDGARPRAADLAVLAARWIFSRFADVELITLPEIGLEERVLVLARIYIFVNAVRAPHPRGAESGFGGWGAIKP